MTKTLSLFVAVTFFGVSLRPTPKITAHTTDNGCHYITVTCPHGFTPKIRIPGPDKDATGDDWWVQAVNSAESARCVVDWKGNAHEK